MCEQRLSQGEPDSETVLMMNCQGKPQFSSCKRACQYRDKNVSENRISHRPSSEVGIVSSCVSWV